MAAIVAAGGTGEMYSLTPPRIWKLYGLWWRGGGRIPVISGTGFNVATGVDLARQSASMGAGYAIRTLTTKDSPSAMLLSFRPRLSPLFVHSRDWVNPSIACLLGGFLSDRQVRLRGRR